MQNKVHKLIDALGRTVHKHSPEILIGLGIAGMVSSCIMAVKVTPKAVQITEELKKKHEVYESDKQEIMKDYATKVIPVYIPSMITGGLSIACIISGNSVHIRRNAAIATAYNLSRTAFEEYKEQAVEMIGEKKEEAIQDKVAKRKLDQHPVQSQEVILTERGNTLFYDMSSGRYFRSDIEKVKKAINILNQRLLSEMYISLNEYYYEIGLPCTTLGNELGWNVDKGLIDVSYSAQLTQSDEPCIAMDYLVGPRYDFSSPA